MITKCPEEASTKCHDLIDVSREGVHIPYIHNVMKGNLLFYTKEVIYVLSILFNYETTEFQMEERENI